MKGKFWRWHLLLDQLEGWNRFRQVFRFCSAFSQVSSRSSFWDLRNGTAKSGSLSKSYPNLLVGPIENKSSIKSLHPYCTLKIPLHHPLNTNSLWLYQASSNFGLSKFQEYASFHPSRCNENTIKLRTDLWGTPLATSPPNSSSFNTIYSLP